jgi:hypothetical protein
MRRRAAVAVPIERVTTDPMRQPFSCKRLPNAHPTRPAPIIATIGARRGLLCDCMDENFLHR